MRRRVSYLVDSSRGALPCEPFDSPYACRTFSDLPPRPQPSMVRHCQNYAKRIASSCGFRFQALFMSCSWDAGGINPLGMFFCGATQCSFPAVSGVHVDPSEEHSAASGNATRWVTIKRKSILNFSPPSCSQRKYLQMLMSAIHTSSLENINLIICDLLTKDMRSHLSTQTHQKLKQPLKRVSVIHVAHIPRVVLTGGRC